MSMTLCRWHHTFTIDISLADLILWFTVGRCLESMKPFSIQPETVILDSDGLSAFGLSPSPENMDIQSDLNWMWILLSDFRL